MPRICYSDKNLSRAKLAAIEQANAVIESYRARGYTLSLRQLYYQFVSRGLIANTEQSYKRLGDAVTDGRMCGLIDWDAVEDRGRGIRPWLIEENERQVVDGLEYNLALNFWEQQNAYVEVWVEKDALSSVVERPCERWRGPFMPCIGYLSSSEAWRSGQRFMEMERAGRRCVVIHLGDHDPSGIDMSRDNDDRLRLFGDGGVELRRIALNIDQVEQYRPPENPTKITDSRAISYIARFGRSSWELDALPPEILDGLITREILTLVDRELWDATGDEEAERREILAMVHGNWAEVSGFIREIDQGRFSTKGD